MYIEVQNRYLGYDDQVHYAYTGGTAFAIGRHHLLTALHLFQPEDEFVEHLKKGTGWPTKILELDPFFEWPEDGKPENTARWNGEGEYEILHVLPDLDVVLLPTKKTHLVTPLCFQPLHSGITRIFTLDLRNYFSQQIHSGRCWTAEELSAEYYFFDSLAEKGFSGGPILGISSMVFVPTLPDRHDAAVGIVVYDAGKQRAISHFVSLAAMFDAFSKKDQSWTEKLKYIDSTVPYHGMFTPTLSLVPLVHQSLTSPVLLQLRLQPLHRLTHQIVHLGLRLSTEAFLLEWIHFCGRLNNIKVCQ